MSKAITELQKHWLNHLQTAQTSGISLVQYAEGDDLKVKDLYQWKTSMVKRGYWSPRSASFVAVKTITRSLATTT